MTIYENMIIFIQEVEECDRIYANLYSLGIPLETNLWQQHIMMKEIVRKLKEKYLKC